MESFDKTISPATPEQKLESLRAQALRKGREFNEEKTREFLGIPLPVEAEEAPVEEAKKPSKKAVKAVKVAEVAKSKATARIKAK